ncbi:MAG: IS1595 family transposase [Bacteroidia bacterium]
MNIIKITKDFNTQAKCLKYLEKVRWGKVVTCPYCDSKDTRTNKNEAGRHSCRNCKRSFSPLIDTIFEDTRFPLPKFFLLIALMLNSKKGVSAKEMQRHLEVSYKTAYYAEMRVRVGMLQPNTKLHGILEMDESYFTSVKKHPQNEEKNIANLATVKLKRGRGSQNKISVAGIVERKGNIKTKVIEKLTKRNLLYFLKKSAKEDDSILITDGFSSYRQLSDYIEHLTINHSKEFSKGLTHVNTIEGFWSYVKNGIRGSYKSISPKYLPLYLVEYEWKYNNRDFKGDQFEHFIKNALKTEKELEHWKAESAEKVKEVAYE